MERGNSCSHRMQHRESLNKHTLTGAMCSMQPLQLDIQTDFEIVKAMVKQHHVDSAIGLVSEVLARSSVVYNITRTLGRGECVCVCVHISLFKISFLVIST